MTISRHLRLSLTLSLLISAAIAASAVTAALENNNNGEFFDPVTGVVAWGDLLF